MTAKRAVECIEGLLKDDFDASSTRAGVLTQEEREGFAYALGVLDWARKAFAGFGEKEV